MGTNVPGTNVLGNQCPRTVQFSTPRGFGANGRRRVRGGVTDTKGCEWSQLLGHQPTNVGTHILASCQDTIDTLGHTGGDDDDNGNLGNQGNCAGDIFIGGCQCFLIGQGGN